MQSAQPPVFFVFHLLVFYVRVDPDRSHPFYHFGSGRDFGGKTYGILENFLLTALSQEIVFLAIVHTVAVAAHTCAGMCAGMIWQIHAGHDNRKHDKNSDYSSLTFKHHLKKDIARHDAISFQTRSFRTMTCKTSGTPALL